MEYIHEENNEVLLKDVNDYLNNMCTIFIDGKTQYHKAVDYSHINL